MKIKVKKLHPDAVIPQYAKPGDAGMDLVAVSYTHDILADQHRYGTGLAFEIPENHVGLIFPRSSSSKTSCRLANCVGVIDSGYRGEVSFVFDEVFNDTKAYEVGDRIGQLIVVPFPKVELVEEDVLSDTERGEDGWGSTGS